MLYYVQPGDTLSQIAQKFNTTVEAILEANLICNANMIFANQPLNIKEPNDINYKAGATPYYVVQPGDSLWCLASQYNIPWAILAEINHLENPSLIHPGYELLIGDYRVDPEELKTLWEDTASVNCDELTPSQIAGIYYLGSFRWEALGTKAIPYLASMIDHPCYVVRFYTAYSLGKLGYNGYAVNILRRMLKDTDASVARMAEIAIKRINLVQKWGKRIHTTTREVGLYNKPSLDSKFETIPSGSELIVLRWAIPSEKDEEGPRGGIQIFDYVQIVNTGKVGFLPRVGFNELLLI